MKGKTTPLLMDCPDNKCFSTLDGKVFRNYADLLDALKRMDDHVFEHHVTTTKNDFKNWVLHVYTDEKLAKDFAANPKRLAMAKSVAMRIKSLALRH